MNYLLLIPLILGHIPPPAWDMADWYLYAEPCATIAGDTLIMRCQSTGLVLNREYTGRLRVSAQVRVTPADDGRFWAGLALNGDVAGDDLYAQAALTQGIAPYWTTDSPWGVQLSTPADRCCDWLVPVDLAEWHTLTVEYDGRGHATIGVDGHTVPVAINLGAAYRIELLCVAVDPGESVPGAQATCEWRDLTVAATSPAASPRRSAVPARG